MKRKLYFKHLVVFMVFLSILVCLPSTTQGQTRTTDNSDIWTSPQVDEDSNKIWDFLEKQLLTSTKDSFECIVRFDSVVNSTHKLSVQNFGGKIVSIWEHALPNHSFVRLPVDKIYDFAKSDHILSIKPNLYVSICLDDTQYYTDVESVWAVPYSETGDDDGDEKSYSKDDIVIIDIGVADHHYDIHQAKVIGWI